MTKSNSPIFEKNFSVVQVKIVPGDTTTAKTLATGVTDQSKVKGISAHSDSSAVETFKIGITRSATFYQMGTFAIPIGQGDSAGSLPADVFALAFGVTKANPGRFPVDAHGNPYIALVSGETLDIKASTTITTSKTVTFTGHQSDY